MRYESMIDVIRQSIRKRFRLASIGYLEFENANGEVVARANINNLSATHRAGVERSMLGMLETENVRNSAGDYVYSSRFDVREKMIGRDVGKGWEVAHPSNNMVKLGRTYKSRVGTRVRQRK